MNYFENVSNKKIKLDLESCRTYEELVEYLQANNINADENFISQLVSTYRDSYPTKDTLTLPQLDKVVGGMKSMKQYSIREKNVKIVDEVCELEEKLFTAINSNDIDFFDQTFNKFRDTIFGHIERTSNSTATDFRDKLMEIYDRVASTFFETRALVICKQISPMLEQDSNNHKTIEDISKLIDDGRLYATMFNQNDPKLLEFFTIAKQKIGKIDEDAPSSSMSSVVNEDSIIPGEIIRIDKIDAEYSEESKCVIQ